ncbi:putative poly(ADP-ribose) polymerase pme-5 isoform X2 [Apostichopus japonicus]|uniref:Poly [ADP-ribose] polymerase n=1 Tax=Stichopus japonicus TaxID=307972 RepID=A0A2G8L773_STIJA|nr:putative poly(ADP-ribose) polymerase pme-5 isoform X2 [Apostichopus japonicus]
MDDDSEGYSDDEDYSEDQDDEDEEEDTKKETEDEFKMTSKIDFSQVDKDNRNVFHYLLLGKSEDDEENQCCCRPIETKKPKTKVDHRVGLTVGVEVVEDSNQQIPYSVLMTKVDVKYGSWGMNNFYKMQFSSHPGKYHLVDAEPHASKKDVKAFNFDLQSNLPSVLPQPLQDLLKQLTSVPMLNAVLKTVKVNTDLMPFGRLKSDVILEAQSILVKLRKLNEEVKHDVDNSKLTEVSSKKMNEILELSSKFYQLIPYSGFAHDKMEPLNTLKLLKEAETDMQNLVDLELANRILLGAQHRIKEVNPLDYIYKALGCKIQQLEEDSPEAQIILQQIEQTREKTPITIEAIYRLAREGEEDALNKLKVGNHQLLWHGTKSSNLISILKRGLLTQPIESAGFTGNLFGQGIYTSSMVCKSMNYCSNFYERAPSKFLLLCEVAVGKSQTDVSEVGFKKGFDSTLGEGQQGPDKNFNLCLKSGASIPMGRVSERTNTTSWLSYDEIVLYSEDQVCLRYLIQFK